MIVQRRKCSFCKRNDLIGCLVKYGVRRYAHGPCLFQAHGREAIDALPTTQLYHLGAIEMLQLGYDVIAAVKKRKSAA